MGEDAARKPDGIDNKAIRDVEVSVHKALEQITEGVKGLNDATERIVALMKSLESHALDCDLKAERALARSAKTWDALKHPAVMESVLAMGTAMSNLGLASANQLYEEARTLINQVDDDEADLMLLIEYYSLRVDACKRCNGSGKIETQGENAEEPVIDECPDCQLLRQRLAVLKDRQKR